LVSAVGVHVFLAITPEVYGAEPRVYMKNLGAVCLYPFPNMMVIVYYGIPKVGVEPSMVIQL
jgi:hypothetical protein